MAQPYVGEIRTFAGSFAPAGWAFCDGSLIPISENETLFQLIGTTYGGDGEESFALPNLNSRVPIHQGSGGGNTYQMGEAGGAESVTLSGQQIPPHTHAVVAASGAGTLSPANATFAASSSSQSGTAAYAAPGDPVALANQVGLSGGSQPHDNCQPFLCVTYIISLFGLFPSPT